MTTPDPRSPTELDALTDQQVALRRVATLVATDPDPQRLFRAVCEELGCVLGVRSANVVRYEEDGTQVIVGAWAVPGAPLFEVGSRVPVDGGAVSAKVRRSGRPQRVDDYAGVPGRLAERVRAVGIRSAAGAPIMVAGRLWGCILASSGEPPIQAGTEDRLADFAELVTAALANADARAQLASSRARIIEAGDRERRRLGRDLHDGAQQVLVGAVISLRLAQRAWERSPREARTLVDEALEQMQAGIRDLRELAAGIHPSVLTDRGLAAALEALASRSPIPVELNDVPHRRLPTPVETTAYFVVAEGLTNAAKHSGCSHVEVTVRIEGNGLTVTVRDDGIGGADSTEGSGLGGLADRVGGLGGVFDVRSPPGEGTAIEARIAVDVLRPAIDSSSAAPKPTTTRV